MSASVLALSGGVGGAKLCLGLADTLPSEALAVLVNTADDFEHLGLHISPDVDTLLYTLSGLANRELGWGIEGETWEAMTRLEQLGGETWFRLGDRDLVQAHRARAGRGRAPLREVALVGDREDDAPILVLEHIRKAMLEEPRDDDVAALHEA